MRTDSTRPTYWGHLCSAKRSQFNNTLHLHHCSSPLLASCITIASSLDTTSSARIQIPVPTPSPPSPSRSHHPANIPRPILTPLATPIPIPKAGPKKFPLLPTYSPHTAPTFLQPSPPQPFVPSPPNDNRARPLGAACSLQSTRLMHDAFVHGGLTAPRSLAVYTPAGPRRRRDYRRSRAQSAWGYTHAQAQKTVSRLRGGHLA